MNNLFVTLRKLLATNASALELSIADNFTRIAFEYIDVSDINDELFLIVYIHSIALAKIVTRSPKEIPNLEYEEVRKILNAVEKINENYSTIHRETN